MVRAAIVVTLFMVAAPRVGEGDRSESRAIGTIRAVTSAEEPNLVAVEDRDGYHFEFSSDPVPGVAITSFAIVAVPTDAGRRTRHAFCADDRAVIYESPPGMTPRIERWRCVDTSKPFDGIVNREF